MPKSKPPKSSSPQNRSVRIFYIIWFGQLISTLGSGLTGFALNVYVYQSTHSYTLFTIGILMFTLPAVFFSPIAGALVDRYPRRWMMILSDTGAGLATFSVLIMVLTENLKIPYIFAAIFFSSLFTTFQWPAHSAATTMLVPQDQLGRAGGMVQIGEAISQLVSPVVAGALYVIYGMSLILAIDFATFLFAVGTLLIVRIPEPEHTLAGGEKEKSIWGDIRFSLDYINARKGLLYLLMYFAAINFLFSIIDPLILPMMLEMGTADKAGLVGSVVGVGVLAGTLIMSAWGGPQRRVFGVLGVGLWGSFALFIMVIQPSLTLVAVAGFLLFGAIPIMNASSQALWQSKTPPEIQGRVFAVRRMLAQFTVPIAILFSGPLVDKVFNPLISETGPLVHTFVGQIVGAGPSRGVRLLIGVVAILQLLVTVYALTKRRLRNVDTDIPNIEIKVRKEEDVVKDLSKEAAAS